MPTTPAPRPTLIELDENLRLRFASPEDANAIVEFNTSVFDERVTHWTRDLVSGQHPTVEAGDFTIVEDVRSRRIVSSMVFIPQTWSYEGISFPVSRVELVATDPECRRLGLVRREFTMQHARRAAKGDLLQVITGVDWFYRQFGYEMGMKMWGSRCVEAAHLRKIDRARLGQCRLRPAVLADHAFIRQVYENAMQGQLFAAARSPAEWDYEFSGRSQDNTRRREWLIVESPDGEALGYVQYLPCLASPHWRMFRIYQIELKRTAGWLNLWPSLLDELWAKGNALQDAGLLPCEELSGIELALERDHPLFRAIPGPWLQEIRPSPWYIRVPSRTALLRKIRPALEKHLVGTAAEGFTGELKLNFCRGGMRLEFARGKITHIERWSPANLSEGNARLPEATFVQLICGWRRMQELADNYPDCRSEHEAAVVLDALFPSFHDKVWVLASLMLTFATVFQMTLMRMLKSQSWLGLISASEELTLALTA